MSLKYYDNIESIDITSYYDGNSGYILWQPWFGGGINNYRQSLEIAYSISFITNRILVIPDEYHFNFLIWGINFGNGWGLDMTGKTDKSPIKFETFFSIGGIKTMFISKFCDYFGFKKWKTEDKFQKIYYEEIPSDIKIISEFTNPYVIYDDVLLLNDKFNKGRECVYIDDIIPKSEKFVYLYQNTLGIYYHQFVTSKINILKKLINKHFRINDLVIDYANNIINKINANYNSIHIRKHIQYTGTIKDSSEIIKILLKKIDIGSDLYISTDDKLNDSNLEFYNNFKNNFNVFFYEDYDSSSPIFEPLIETLICARSKTFFGQFPSTFSSYIWRLRGLMGDVDSTFYDNYREYEIGDNNRYIDYNGLYSFFAKETPDAWLYD